MSVSHFTCLSSSYSFLFPIARGCGYAALGRKGGAPHTHRSIWTQWPVCEKSLPPQHFPLWTARHTGELITQCNTRSSLDSKRQLRFKKTIAKIADCVLPSEAADKRPVRSLFAHTFIIVKLSLERSLLSLSALKLKARARKNFKWTCFWDQKWKIMCVLILLQCLGAT